jgi:hypothetical protein
MKKKITVYSLKNTQRKGEEVSHKGNRVNRGLLYYVEIALCSSVYSV